MKIHFWDLPEKRSYIVLKDDFKHKLSANLKNKKYKWKIRNKIKNGKISIEKIKKISEKESISLKLIEKNICWVGGNVSKGLSNPKFPIDFQTRSGARFIAAIVNDGTLTKNGIYEGYGRLMYDNYDKSLRDSVIDDYLNVFGGKKDEVAFRQSERKKYLEFSSVIRDIMELILKSKGSKAESNLKIPQFIFQDKNLMLGWIEQTIADEGDVKNYIKSHRRAIVWRRSIDISPLFKRRQNIMNRIFKKDTSIKQLPINLQNLIKKQNFNLIEGEKKMLDSLGIDYRIYHIGVYKTEKNKIRTRTQIGIAKRENLLKLRSLIKIPSKDKDKTFSNMFKYFKRYKEPLKIKQALVELGRAKNKFSPLDFKIKMHYKSNVAYKWFDIFEKEGIIKKINGEHYINGRHKQQALYKLILNK